MNAMKLCESIYVCIIEECFNIRSNWITRKIIPIGDDDIFPIKRIPSMKR